MSSRQHLTKAREEAVPLPSTVAEVSRSGRRGRQDHPLLYVGDISKKISRAEVHRYLSKFGEISYFSMPFYLCPDNHKGFAKVYFSNIQATDAILRTKCHRIKNRMITVIPWEGKGQLVSKKEDPSENKVFFRFKKTIPEAELMEYFSQFGPVDKIDIRYYNRTKVSRDFGFIVFRDVSSTSELLSKENPHMIIGKEVFVSPSKSTAELHLLSERRLKRQSEIMAAVNSKTQYQAESIESSGKDCSEQDTFPKSLSGSIRQQLPDRPVSTTERTSPFNPRQSPVSKGLLGSIPSRNPPSPVSKRLLGDLPSRNPQFPVSTHFRPAEHLVKPSSSRWHHEIVDFNHFDCNNLTFKKLAKVQGSRAILIRDAI